MLEYITPARNLGRQFYSLSHYFLQCGSFNFHTDPSTGPLPPLQRCLLPQPGLQWDAALSGITHSLSGVSLHLIPLRCLQAPLPLSTSRQQCPGWVEGQPSLIGAMFALLPDEPLWPHLEAFRLVLVNINTSFCDL